MTTRLFLVRHAETTWHAENRYTGSSNIGLTTRGFAQADALGRWARGARLDAIYSSDLTRSRLTAQPSAEATGLGVRIEPRVREIDFGRGEGLTRTEMATQFPEALAAFLANPGRSPLPGGESGVAGIARARPALHEIAAAHPGGRVLVVMHSTLLRLMLTDLLGINPDGYRKIFPETENCALNEILLGAEPGDPAAIVRLNAPTGA